ncbi:MAG: OmpA family protein [Bacteroidales bacterium]|nr:OmpA family protein [Bacteroidales bacterium]
MKRRLITTLVAALLVVAANSALAQNNKTSGGKKKEASPYVEGRQKVRQTDFDTIWKFTNFAAKGVHLYYVPFDYTAMPYITGQKRPDWGTMQPAVNYLTKVSRAPMLMCAVFAINPAITDPEERETLVAEARGEAIQAINAFDAWKTDREMHNKVKYQIAEVDYRYWRGAAYFNEPAPDDAIIHVGMLLYFGTKKVNLFPDPSEGAKTFADIKFFPNDATIADSWFSHIDSLAVYLKNNDRRDVLIVGYADNSGTEAYNLGLSRQRAVEVKKALLARGIDEVRIEVQARGSEEPLGDNDTYEGRIANNRVAIKIQ